MNFTSAVRSLQLLSNIPITTRSVRHLHHHDQPQLSTIHASLRAPHRFFSSLPTRGVAAVYEETLAECGSEELYRLPSQNKTIEDLASMHAKKKLNLFPEYQRDYVWNRNDKVKNSKASRLVVTALCNRLIPPIVMHEKKKNKYDVVDGKQRLSSLLAFFYGDDLNSPVEGFTELGGLVDEYESLNGCRFSDLSEERQEGYKNYSLTVLSMTPKTPNDDVFAVYQDINSGGANLTTQQLRRAAFYGSYIKLLDKLVKNPDFLVFRGATEPAATEEDREMVLRAFALHHRWRDFKAPLSLFLNRELKVDLDEGASMDKSSLKAKSAKKEVEFAKVMSVAKVLFGADAFRMPGANKISLPLWDGLYHVLADVIYVDRISRPQLQGKADVIRDDFNTLCEDPKFVRSLKSLTQPSFRLRTEMLRRCIVEHCGPGPIERGPRCFSKVIVSKTTLFDKQNGRCAICNNKLLELAKAEVDHIEPYAKGGKTEANNAQLVHQSCNASKGARV